MKFIKPLNIGSLRLASNIIYAPLAGCSDFPFRQMASLYKPGLMYCEMVKMDALIRHDLNSFRLLDFSPEMAPIGAQLCGSKPHLAGPCAKIIEDLGFDTIDLNCGCPVDKVTKDGSGSGLLKTPQLIGDIIANMVSAVTIPVTLKIRTGWDDHHIIAPQITRIAEQAGAKAISIHGRTRAQKYTGSANWDHIRTCKQVANQIKVIGNGDVFNAHDALALFSKTECDGVLVSRGTFGQPWIAENIKRLDQKDPFLEINGIQYRDALLKHMEYIFCYQNERKGLLDMRRVGCWYLRQAPYTKKLRESLNRSKNLEEVKSLIQNYDWDQYDK